MAVLKLYRLPALFIASNINLFYRNTQGLTMEKQTAMQNKLSIYIILSILSLIWAPLGYSKPPQHHTSLPPEAIISKRFQLPWFSGVSIKGPMSVSIAANQLKSTLQIRTDSQTLAEMNPHVEHGILYLIPPDQPLNYARQPILVNINLPKLTHLEKRGAGNISAINLQGELSVHADGPGNVALQGHDIDLRSLQADGPANITITGVNSRQLNVQQDGLSNVNLRGTAVLQSLDYYGSGSFSLYWVNSTRVKIVASGAGKISLAGVTCLLDVTLYDHVCLAAKQLHAQQAFINTNNRSQANVWVKDSLSTLARGWSNIYYYKIPAFMGSYSNPPAATLRMNCLPRN